MKKLFFVLLGLPVMVFAQKFELKQVASGTPTSMRGLSVVSDEVAWVSGSNGYIGKTVDGGNTWDWQRIKGYEKLDFRDIEAFDEKNAIVVNAGSPAYILKTNDGGASWQEVYKNTHKDIFLDGMDFWNANQGIIFGDPINHKMQLLMTINGGLSWVDISDQLKLNLAEGEAGFAASGTTIRTLPGGYTWIASGGMVSNIYFSKNYGKTWEKFPIPIIQGNNSAGPFTISFYNKNNGVAVGGDYLQPNKTENNVLWTADGGKTWHKPLNQVSGYRSGSAYISEKTILATGTNGTDISLDGGNSWTKLDDKLGNAVQKAKKGNLILIVGNGGKIYKVVKTQ